MNKMSIQIEVNGAHAQLLIEFYLKRMKALRDEILEREREMKEITMVIQKLKKGGSSTTVEAENTTSVIEYSDKWPWVKKIEFAIEQQRRPLTTKEIVEVLTEFEPTFLFDRKRVVASISSTLSTKSGIGKEFKRVDTDSGDFAYDLNKVERDDELEPLSTPEDDFDEPF